MPADQIPHAWQFATDNIVAAVLINENAQTLEKHLGCSIDICTNVISTDLVIGCHIKARLRRIIATPYAIAQIAADKVAFCDRGTPDLVPLGAIHQNDAKVIGHSSHAVGICAN